MHKLIIATFILLTTSTGAAMAQDEQEGNNLTFSTGIDYSSGRYGQPKSTDIVVDLTNVALTTGDFRFSLSLPYLNIVGPPYVIASNGGGLVLVKQKGAAKSTVRDGWGDLNIGTTYTWQPDGADGYDVEFTGNVKLATANAAKGLSTGEDDISLSADISRQFGSWSPFVTFGYLIPGSPKAYSLNSAPQFSVGTSVQITDDVLATASYDFNGAITHTLSDAQQLFAAGSWLVNDSLSFTVYAEYGLTAGAPKQGTGLLISWKLPV